MTATTKARSHRALAVAGALASWKLVDLLFQWIGLVDEVRGVFSPDHWLIRLLFWSHLGTLISAAGVLMLIALWYREHISRFLAKHRRGIRGGIEAVHAGPLDDHTAFVLTYVRLENTGSWLFT